MAPAEVIQEMTKAEADAQRIRQLEENLKRAHDEILEYVCVEQVLMAARKINEETFRQAHELVRNCS